MSALPAITTEQPTDAKAVDALIERAFGPGRLAKAAERLREGNAPLADLCQVAREDGEVVGCARMWPIHIGSRPAVLLGPLAVDPAWRSRGLGAAVVTAACEAARVAGHGLVLLVGDAPYFDRLGFAPVDRSVVLPGPVDIRRVLVRALKAGAAAGLSGAVTR